MGMVKKLNYIFTREQRYGGIAPDSVGNETGDS